MRKIFLFFAWSMLITGVSLSGLSIFQLQQDQAQQTPLINPSQQRQVMALPAQLTQGETFAESVVEVEDGRAVALRNFIERYNPNLLEEEANFHQELVAIADEYDLDFRLLPAIAMKESGLCRAIPEGSFNCLGLGVHSRGTWHFPSYRENFAKAAEILKKNYIEIGLVTPEQIMTKYTPNSPEGAWAKGVNQFMTEIRFDDRERALETRETNHVLELAR